MSPADWPFRETQIQSLASLVHQPHMPFIYVSGEPSTGKTDIVRCVGLPLHRKATPSRFIQARASASTPQNGVHQLHGTQEAEPGDSGAGVPAQGVPSSCDLELRHDNILCLQTHKRKKKAETYMSNESSNIDVFQHLPQLLANNASAYVILDAPEHLEDQAVVPLLQHLPELLDVRMGLLIISQLPWGNEHLRGRVSALPMPAIVHMPQYTAEQATTVCYSWWLPLTSPLSTQ